MHLVLVMILTLVFCGCDLRPEQVEEKKEAAPAAVSSVCDDEQNGACTYFDSEGRKSLEVNYSNGELDGAWLAYYENGQVASKGSWAKGQQSGPWEFWHYNGQKRLAGSYVAGQKSGKWTQYNEKGEELGSSTLGQPGTGTYTEWHDNGKKSVEQKLQAGKVVEEIRYRGDGTKDFQVSYDASGNRSGVFQAWATDGNTLVAKYEYKGGRKEGTQTEWYSNGAKKQDAAYKDYFKTGQWTDYYPSGQVKRTRHYVEGRRQGNWISYYDNEAHQVSKDEHFEASVPTGTVTTYFEDGGVESESHYAAGKKTGKWTEFQASNLPASAIHYANNRKDGEVRTYHAETGYHAKVENYKDGDLHGVTEEYYNQADGVKKAVTHYENGVKSGASSQFYADGKVKSEGAFLDGKKHGNWSTSYPSGNLESAVRYYKGELFKSYTEYFDQAQGTETRLPERVTGYFVVTNDAPEGKEENLKSHPEGKWIGYSAPKKVATTFEYAPVQGAIDPDAAPKEGDAEEAEEFFDDSIKTTAVFHHADGSEWLNLVAAPGGWEDSSRAINASGKIENAKLQGTWSLTRSGGKMMMEVDFVDSVRHGPYRQWYLSGSLESEGQYNNGKIDGKWTAWDANGKLLAITCYAGGEKQWTSFEETSADCGASE